MPFNTTGSTITQASQLGTGVVTTTAILDETIVNADIATNAAIAYSKLSLGTSIVNADIATNAAIAYSKLSLGTSIVNADISTTAAIAYSKLALGTSIVNADISTTAAIARTKIAEREVKVASATTTATDTITSTTYTDTSMTVTITGLTSGKTYNVIAWAHFGLDSATGARAIVSMNINGVNVSEANDGTLASQRAPGSCSGMSGTITSVTSIISKVQAKVLTGGSVIFNNLADTSQIFAMAIEV